MARLPEPCVESHFRPTAHYGRCYLDFRFADSIELTDASEVIVPMEVDSEGVVGMTDSLDILHASPESRVGYARIGYSEVTIYGFGGANDFVTFAESFGMDASLESGDTVGATDSLATTVAAPESGVGTARVGYSEVA